MIINECRCSTLRRRRSGRRVFGTSVVVFVLAAIAVGCGPRVPIGDGTLTGAVPPGWRDIERRADEIVLVVHDETIPLPREIVVRRLRSGPETSKRWESVGEANVPAPATRVGDRWRENFRRVRRYRRTFPDGWAFEADIDARLAENGGLLFLRRLRPAESSL